MHERTQIALKLILSHFVILFSLVTLSFLIQQDSLLIITISETFLIILFLSGYWEFFGIRFRWMYCISIQTLLLVELYWKTYFSLYEFKLVLAVPLALVQLYLIFLLIKILVVIFEKGRKSIEIDFPIKGGRYLITDGGNSKISRLMNYHYYSPVHRKNKTNKSMLYATDIVKLLKKNRHFLPIKNTDYAIYEEKVFSPIHGTVTKVIHGIPDNEPFSGKYPYNTGNTVVIKNENLYLLLGHLKPGSIQVKEGDNVQKNTLIAEIGNSGWTERPHLHMQLMESQNENYWYGTGICMKFKNKNLYKNRIINMHKV